MEEKARAYTPGENAKYQVLLRSEVDGKIEEESYAVDGAIVFFLKEGELPRSIEELKKVTKIKTAVASAGMLGAIVALIQGAPESLDILEKKIAEAREAFYKNHPNP